MPKSVPTYRESMSLVTLTVKDKYFQGITDAGESDANKMDT